ncbi:MAG TPA: hypothetical protein VKT51_00995 [Candidatus Eremiobacteraceae bacterium]|nr:hypothetical protein [Candidatus Eremiobacteraceae bacterium]
MPEFIRQSSEDEMILEFVRAELESPIHRDRCKIPSGYTLAELVGHPDLKNADHNAARLSMLFYRGYATRSSLFTGFPREVAWTLHRFTLAEIGSFKYAKVPPWSTLVDHDRLVSEGAMEIENARDRALSLKVPVKAILDVRRKFETGKTFSRLIAAEIDGSYVIVEGNARATAFIGSREDRPVEAIVGHADNFKDWPLR